MDPEKEKSKEAIVLDTNIILASILKRGSYTRQVIVYLTDVLGVETYTPEKGATRDRRAPGRTSQEKGNTC